MQTCLAFNLDIIQTSALSGGVRLLHLSHTLSSCPVAPHKYYWRILPTASADSVRARTRARTKRRKGLHAQGCCYLSCSTAQVPRHALAVQRPALDFRSEPGAWFGPGEAQESEHRRRPTIRIRTRIQESFLLFIINITQGQAETQPQTRNNGNPNAFKIHLRIHAPRASRCLACSFMCNLALEADAHDDCPKNLEILALTPRPKEYY
ncbi:hypothetical protein B0H14DRAFT_1432667 [Mycena olivaceomarginata]|nr:hypothetical protein B0H14DRAFT_1432667 [Mycena olivaceomarginata]